MIFALFIALVFLAMLVYGATAILTSVIVLGGLGLLAASLLPALVYIGVKQGREQGCLIEDGDHQEHRRAMLSLAGFGLLMWLPAILQIFDNPIYLFLLGVYSYAVLVTAMIRPIDAYYRKVGRDCDATFQ